MRKGEGLSFGEKFLDQAAFWTKQFIFPKVFKRSLTLLRYRDTSWIRKLRGYS